MAKAIIEQQAKLLAVNNKVAEPSIEGVYWFPDDDEVRLIALDPTVPKEQDGIVHPFYFRPSPQDSLFAPSAIALIRPEEFGSLALPRRWGAWGSAVVLELKP